MAWLVLVVSGFFEAVWAAALGMSNNFRRWRPVLVVAITMPTSLAGLAYAMRTLPTGTAYAVWVGIGASLTVLWAITTKREAASTARLLLLLLLVGSVAGLKVVS
ncbi:QacE family quaternary ammonium compound efflux SMR transporter [Mycobacterium sp. SMC-8]|uniref:DMT family transporter n=1 Tax=Mycobacterium sp. SMC-8 TaxID=2857060 RepID=UPI0021B25BAB|nr:SMR family transporter [Mycobacterium sp. SMC-8]UXA14387.1 QacE family quaternary ammonium compound efflux SMR transporter [Mycobacterium sp. SMC-8]